MLNTDFIIEYLNIYILPGGIGLHIAFGNIDAVMFEGFQDFNIDFEYFLIFDFNI